MTPETPIGPSDVSALVGYFGARACPRDEWAVGTEYEAIAVANGTNAPLPYAGPQSVRAILDFMAARFGWNPVAEGENVVALERGGVTITLEPGGQVEFSGAPLRGLRDSCRELEAHRRELAETARALDISWLWIGMNPIHTLDEIPLMPKGRYARMFAYLPRRGGLARRMMKQSCSVQATFDFSDDRDAMEKTRVAYAVSPIVTGVFANSPFLEGRPTGYRSFRAHVWTDVDPDRCGTPPPFVRGEYTFQAYAEWLLDTPMFFVQRDGRYVDVGGSTFRHFLANGAGDVQPLYRDWVLHTSTAFPTVRLKQQIEVRGADAVPPALLCGAPALWFGLLYDETARAEALELARGLDGVDSTALAEAVARDALCARVASGTVGDLARELVEISHRGLGRHDRSDQLQAALRLLEPVRESVHDGCSPADRLIRAYQAAGGGAAGMAEVLRLSTDNGPDAHPSAHPPRYARTE